MSKKKRKQKKEQPSSISISQQPSDDESTSLQLLIPAYFVEEQMHGEEQKKSWTKKKSWEKLYQRNSAETIILGIYSGDEDQQNHMARIFKNLHRPLSPEKWDYHRPWLFKLKPINIKTKSARDEPFTIICFYNEAGRVVQNVAYDAWGDCFLEVDFETHGCDDVHWHTLVPGNFDHKSAGDEHAYDWKICPWVFLAIPKEYEKEPLLCPENKSYVETTHAQDTDYNRLWTTVNICRLLLFYGVNPRVVEGEHLVVILQKAGCADPKGVSALFIQEFWAEFGGRPESDLTSETSHASLAPGVL